MRSNLRWVLVLTAACGSAGCASGPSKDPAGGAPDVPELAAQAHPGMNGVPVPVGFKYDVNKSRSATSPGWQYVDHNYTGSADRYAVARFYWRQMPLSGWTRKPEDQSQGIINQEFEREGETCRVRISDGGLFVGTEIHLTVFPNPQAKGPAGAPGAPGNK